MSDPNDSNFYVFDDAGALLQTQLPLPRKSGKVRDVYDLGESLLCHHPGTGLAFAGFAPGEEPSTSVLDGRLEAIDRAGRSAAACVIEALPAVQKGGRDVFGSPGPERRLMAGLKERFDPQRVLNPGRFQGRI